MLGFALGAWTNSLYVDLTGDIAFYLRVSITENLLLGKGRDVVWSFGRFDHETFETL